MNTFRLYSETRIALIYLVFGGLWILFSDRLLVRLAATPQALTQIQTYKGWFFVAVSALLIFFLLRHSLEKERRAQAALKENQERILQGERQYRLLFENNPLPMWIYDQETLRFLAVNQAACRKYGYSNDEFLCMTIKDIRPENEVPKLLQNIQNHREQTQASVPWIHRKKDGQFIYVDVFSYSLEYFGSPARLVMALDLSNRYHPQVVLMDVGLPGMNGIEAARQIKHDSPRTFVIIHTIYDEQAYRLEAAKAGVDAFIVKSRSQSDLIPILSKAFAALNNSENDDISIKRL